MAKYAEQKALDLLKEELLIICNNDDFSNYEIFVDTDFTKKQDELSENQIYFVVSVEDGTIGHGSIYVNAHIDIVSSQKNIDICRNIVNAFTTTYNLKPITRSGSYIIQAYTTPGTNSNFNQMQNDYASLLYFEASFKISENISVISEIALETSTDTYENIDFLQISLTYGGTNDTRVYPFTTNAYSQSVIQFGTISFTIQAFFKTDVSLINEALSMSDKTKLVNQDKEYNFRFKIGDDYFYYSNMKILSFNVVQTPESLPVCVIGFSQ